MNGIEASEIRQEIGRNVAKEVICIYKSTWPKLKWLLIENGEYFRLHKIQNINKVRTNGGLASFSDVIEHSFSFCFIPGETPGMSNIHMYSDVSGIPEFYRRDMHPNTIMVSNTHKNYKFKNV